MPIATATLFGPGTFSQTITPTTNTALTLSAVGSVQIPNTATGYISVSVQDSSGSQWAMVIDLIRDSERLSGTKTFQIQCSQKYLAALTLSVTLSVSSVDGGSAPTITSASLISFGVA